MSWEREVEELDERRRLAAAMGGPERVARQRVAGKQTIRERLDAFCDAGSFEEVGALAGVGQYDKEGRLLAFTPSNFLCGMARVDGRTVVVSGDDFTIRGGSSEATIPAKRAFAEQIALELRLPHVRLVDGMGGGGSVKAIEQKGRTLVPRVAGWETVVQHLGVAPSVALALGSVAGIGAARVATAHYSVIVAETAQLMIAGPALVEQAALGTVSKEELGHARIHAANGSVDDMVATEEEAFARARRFLSYLPQNVDELPARTVCDDDPERRDERLLSVVPREPRRTYKMREVIEAVVDRGSWFEMGRNWGRSVVTGFCRLDGWPVALFAEDPYVYGGAWTAGASRKVARFIDLASTFHLPLVHLEDCPGFLIGKQSEEEGTIRFGALALAALGQSTSPFCAVIVRKAFGVAGAANAKPGATHFRYCWPSGDWGSLPIEGGLEVAYRAELAGLGAEEAEAAIARIRERLNRYRSPFRSAEVFEMEDVVDPRETRPLLCRWANLVAPARRAGAMAWTFRP
ncbi:MAG: methylmalonyl-CoA carboxyltransferase [Dehalococcoidia bacterium]|nr:methylmalonyl-CoA carboxyltransferase [Dehalococcoidia bacterium]